VPDIRLDPHLRQAIGSGRGEPVKGLAAQFPDLRRFIREGYVRYAFTRFGVPYVVSIQCLDSIGATAPAGVPRAYPVAERFLKALRVAGGQPSRPRTDILSSMAERPTASSPDFTYRPSGDIVANSGARKQGGHAELTAYSQIRFPLERLRRSRIRNPSAKANPTSEPRNIRGGTISAKRAALRSGNAPAVLATRGRTYAPRRARRTTTAARIATPSNKRSSRPATAS
jgi:hypothetical protein